ncbi:MAG: site-specific integrase [Gudongella sp.]|nr:site-specific integrase [Gudongella sp.]
MGRYPFNEYADELIEKMKLSYAPETVANRARRYRRMGALVNELKEQKKISTSSPKQFTEKDVYAIIAADTPRRSSADMVHEVNALRKLMSFVDNPALEVCLNHNPELKPKIRGNRRKQSMSIESYNVILDKALKVDPADFDRLRAYALVLLCLDTGTRNKEIRLATEHDLDISAWTLYIAHPKGEMSYGEAREVPIREEIRPVIAAYLRARKVWLVENSCGSPALFPSNSPSSKDGCMCGNSLRRIKKLVEDETHVKFDLRECRRTFGQRYLDDELELSSVSVLMGHSSTKTTERFYGRQKNTMAIDKARSTWQKPQLELNTQVDKYLEETAQIKEETSSSASGQAPADGGQTP